MPGESIERGTFSLETAISLRVKFLEAQKASGAEGQIARSIKTDIDALDMKMTEQEKKECWDLALDQLADTEQHDKELQEKYASLPKTEKRESISDQEAEDVLARLREGVDSRFRITGEDE